LLQVQGHFFASVETVLNSLQLHNEVTLPFVDCLAYGRTTLRPPAYITTQITRFDLSHLVKQDILFLSLCFFTHKIFNCRY
jgi:hypothetical protein